MALWEILDKPWNRELRAWTPLLRNPFTDIGGVTGFHASGSNRDGFYCPDFEARFGDCMEAYGPLRGVHECRSYREDLLECAQQWRQRMRVEIMQAERERQWKAGERKERYAPPPRPDAY